MSEERRRFARGPAKLWRGQGWRHRLLLAALLAAGWSFAAGGDGSAATPGGPAPAGVPFRIELNLDPTPAWAILGERERFTPPGAPLVLRTLLEHVKFRRETVEEPFVKPLQENLPAVWLPLSAYRPGAGGAREAIPGAALLIRSPRLRLVPLDDPYLVLLQYLGPGEMAEPLRIASDPPTQDSNRFPVLIVSFRDLLSEGGSLPQSLVIAGELVVDGGTP